MSIRKQNITFASTGQDFDINKNSLGEMTSLYLTTVNFSLPESELQDIDTLFDYMLDGKIFPIHRIFNYEPLHKEQTYTESIQDFSYRSYRGKDIFKIKYDIRPDYHQLLKQFEGQEMRLIIGINNNSFLCTKYNNNVRGYLLSNITIEDIEIFNTNLSPLRIELADKTERDNELQINSGYRLFDLDRRILNISIDVTTSTTPSEAEATLSALYLGTPIETLVLEDITFNDDINGVIAFDIINYNEGIYKLYSPDKTPTSGCVTINSYGYIGRNKYKLRAIIAYSSWILIGGDNFVTVNGGDNLVFVNTN